jgi:uncharacterized membrane protein YeaQ/YmgE (transglycosylase-associated protein family)
MSGSTLLSALTVGVIVGVLGRLVLPGRNAAPAWLAVALGVAAALLGSVSARLAGVDPGVDTDQWAPHRLVAQIGFAVPVVVLGVVAAGRRRRSPVTAGDPGRSADHPGDRRYARRTVRGRV